MTNYDFLSYWEQCVSEVDVAKLYRQMEGRLNRNNRGRCVRCGNDTLYLNRDWHSFRCLNLLCNDHGDVVSLIQRTAGLSFPDAFAILDAGRCRSWWSINDLEKLGAVRDCMTAAALFCANRFSPVEPYVNRQGIPTELAQQFLIGAAWGTGSLKNYLLEKGFPLEVMRLTGLFNEEDQERFEEHVVIPLREYGQVFDFYARYVGDDPQIIKDCFLPQERLSVGRGYFNWNPDREQFICVKGVFDALSLFHNGFPNVVATGSDNLLDPTYLKGTKIKRLLLCVGSDETDRERVIGTAHACEEAGIEMRIIELPDSLSPNEYFLEHSAADFTLRLINAKPLEHWQAERPER
jgi:DNA primase